MRKRAPVEHIRAQQELASRSGMLGCVKGSSMDTYSIQDGMSKSITCKACNKQVVGRRISKTVFAPKVGAF